MYEDPNHVLSLIQQILKYPCKGLSGGNIRLKSKKKSLGEVCGCTSEVKTFILSRKFSSDFKRLEFNLYLGRQG